MSKLKSFAKAAVPLSVLGAAQKAQARMALARWRRSLGSDVLIDPTVQVLGLTNVKIGSGTQVGEFGWFNVNHRTADESRIGIGRNCLIGRRNLFSSGESIQIDDFCLTASDVAFLCSDHIIADPSRPYVASGNAATDRIVVEPNCWFGLGALVLGNVVVGRGSVVSARSIVLEDVPPFSIVVGTPARVIKRYSFVERQWIRADKFDAAAEAAIPGLEEYRAQLSVDKPVSRTHALASGYVMGSR